MIDFLQWKNVTSGLLDGFVLRLIFNTFICNLENREVTEVTSSTVKTDETQEMSIEKKKKRFDEF